MINARIAGRALGLAPSFLLLLLAAAPAVAGGPESPMPGRPKQAVEQFLFAGIPWGVTADTALQRLAQRGYQPIAETKGAAMFSAKGRLFDQPAWVHGFLDDHRGLARWQIGIMPKSTGYEYPPMRRVYDDAVTDMLSKYGQRRSAQDHFSFPYEKGEGKEDRALREGKAVIRSEWKSRAGDLLTVEMDKSQAVIITYETEAWAASEARRKQKKASDL